jgi:hypothetical protein
MYLFSLVARWNVCLTTVLCSVFLLCLTGPRPAQAETNMPPTVTIQPTNGVAGVGEDFAFTALAGGTAPFSYQWSFNGSALSGQTNTFLLLTNLAVSQSGPYSVTVNNLVGSVVSSNATLTVETNVPRRLGTGRILQVGSQVGVPITFRANGRENAVSFSLSYDTNAYSNPVFLPAPGNATNPPPSTSPNAVGVSMLLPPGQMFPAGYQWLGLVQFDLAAGCGPLQGGLAFTNIPTLINAINTNNLPLTISGAVQPQFVMVSSVPGLDYQSGLFKQQLIIGNPSATTMSNIDILALNLGLDSLSNAVAFTNAQGILTNYPAGDFLVAIQTNACCGFSLDATNNGCDLSNYLACGNGSNFSIDYTGSTNPLPPFAQIDNLPPGDSNQMTVTIEFYVSDHITVPPPNYSLFLANPFLLVPPAYFNTPLTITTNRFVNGTMLVEFPTQLGQLYYVQYANTVSNLMNSPLTVLPPITGTGSRVQWVDDGPPKTVSSPTNVSSRVYRVLTFVISPTS